MTWYDSLLQQLADGLVLGSFYALVALGYTMVFGVIKLLNFAHGDLYMTGAFAGFGGLSLVSGVLGAGWLGIFVAMLLAMLAVFCLPRQFHITVVENTNTDDAKRARWLFPLYLVLIGLFVLPLAAAGLSLFPGDDLAPDSYVLALPIVADQRGWPAGHWADRMSVV